MTTFDPEPTWGVTGPQFLWLYGALSLGAAIWILATRWAALRPAAAAGELDSPPGVYELAMLGGGAQLAITSAATQLMSDGVLERGASHGTLAVCGELAEDAAPLERAVFGTVARRPGLSVDAMRAAVLAGAARTTMRDELVAAGLLLPDETARALRWHRLVCLALLALGFVRVYAADDDNDTTVALLAMVFALFLAGTALSQRRLVATRAGDRVLRRRREWRPDLEHDARPDERALAAAVFGREALWLADPQIASALGVPRDHFRGGRPRGGGCGEGD